MILVINQVSNEVGFFSILVDRISEGGFLVMTLIIISGLLTIVLMVRGLLIVKRNNLKLGKIISLINSIGLFALVLGVFGQLLLLITTLDFLHYTQNLQANQLAGGLKFTMLPTLFGCFVFLMSRFFTIVLNFIKPTPIEPGI